MSSTRQGQLPRWGRNIRGARRRLAVLAAQVVVAGLCVAMAGASAQQMQFASYPDFAANHVIETCTVDAGGNQNAIPEFDWGEPIWIRVSNVFFADANFTDGEVAFKFWRKSVPSYGFMVLQASGTGALPTVGLRAFEPLEDNLAAFQDNTQPIPLDHRYQGIIQPSSINRLDFNGNSYRNCRVYGGLALPDTAHPARLSTTPKGWPAAEPPVFRAVFTPGEWCIRVEQAHTSGDDAQARTYPSAAGYITIRVRNPLLLRERQTDGGAVSLMEDVAHPEWAWQNGSPTFRASVWAGQAGNLLHGYWNGTTATDPTFSELNTGRVRHGVTSDRYPFYVVDNSRWRTSVDGSGLASGLGADPLPSSLRVRFDRPSLNPTGRDSIGTAALPTNVIDATGALLATVPWGPGPYQAIPPDMPASRPTDPGSFRAFPTNGANLAFYWINDLNAELDNTKPALADITTGALVPPVFGAGTPRPAYTVANREFKATLRVPLYQADTGYQTGDPGLPTGVYPTASNSIAAFIDSDADGVRAPDEAYRDFNVSVQVPADFRMRPSAATATIDFGLVAHNTLSPEKTLAVQNIGNVGLRWLRIDEERRRTGPTESRYKNLFSAANDHDASSVLQNVGKGVCIPPWESASVTVGAPRRHLWW